MSNSRSTKLHVAMFPWFAFGHITLYLQVHLSNKLTERGHRVSFLLPKGAQAKIEHLILYPNLIHFYSLLVPSVDRLPLVLRLPQMFLFHFMDILVLPLTRPKTKFKPS